MLQFEFSQNFNGKLFLDHFGDIRSKNEVFTIGEEGEVLLKNISLGYAVIEAARNFPFSRISDALSLLNCGKPAPYQAQLLNNYYGHGNMLAPDHQLVHVIFRYTQRNIENQTKLITEWWNEKTTHYDKNVG
jgi:hypothetical protein